MANGFEFVRVGLLMEHSDVKNENHRDTSVRFREIAVLAFIPAMVGILILISWALDFWEIGHPFWHKGIALTAALFGGYTRFVEGFGDILKRRITVNVFVAVALTATIAIGEFRAAALIVFIMSVSGALEAYTLDKNRLHIRNLLDLAPRMATVRRGDEEISMPASEVRVGDIVIVRPGERIPVDGMVTAGASSVNQAPITGESMPVEKFIGSEVFSGSLNEAGRLEIETTKTGEDTTLARIVHLVEEAQRTRAPIQNMADRFTVWFLPTVLVLAVIGFFTSGDIKVSVSILLVACPCAFAIATPTAVTAGIANMARRAVLIKGGIFLELAGKIETLLVDKTGTFTLGRPRVMEVVALNGVLKEDVLRLASIAEKYSEHPLARAVLDRAREEKIQVPDPEKFRVESGRGVTAHWAGKDLLVGNREFLQGKGIALGEEIASLISHHVELGRTVILVADNAHPMGLISVADEIRPETVQSIVSLKAMGIRNITMLTGDNPRVARAVAAEIGVDDFRAGLLPEQKQEYVKRLQSEGQKVGMIGDGINDAPALALADVGIAMGAGGTDVAIDTADVTLMTDDLSRVAEFIWMSKKVIRRIKMNIFFSIIYNVIGLTLGSIGLLTPVLAVIFQEGGCITVVMSSTLLLWARPDGTGGSRTEAV